MPMAPELDMGAGMEMMPMSMMGMDATSASLSTAYLCGLPASDAMRIDELLDFSNKEDFFDAAANVSVAENHQHGHLPPHEPSAAAWSFDTTGYNPSSFSDDFYMPSEEVAELEWLSKFVDDSFSDVPFPSSSVGCGDDGVDGALSSMYNVLPTEHSSSIPARARSKRSRPPATALHHNTPSWSSQTPRSSPFTASPPTSPSSSSSELPLADGTPNRPPKGGGRKKEAETGAAAGPGMECGVRRCTHCSSEKTPQWRTGPLGPKTLCNACGVRYKSGRLVPEYRPAASPTFVLTQHSNSHRKVLELRRQKELLLRHSPRAGMLFHDYEAC